MFGRLTACALDHAHDIPRHVMARHLPPAGVPKQFGTSADPDKIATRNLAGAQLNSVCR